MDAEQISYHSKTHRRALFTTWLTTLFDWYNFFVYAIFAGIFAKQFYSHLPPDLAYLAGLATSLVGFLFRPLGAILLSPLGDKVGRKYAFLICMIVIAFASVGVGLLPSYESIGIAAPILLIIFRILQGIGLGGEYGAAYTFINEHAPAQQRAKYASIVQSSSIVAFALCLFVSWALEQIFGQKSYQEWAWRLAFLIAIVFLVISLIMRMNLEESPVFLKIKSQQALAKKPLLEVYKSSRYTFRQVILLLGFVSSHAVVSYTARIYTFVFLTSTLHVTSHLSNLIIGLAAIAALPGYWLAGVLANRYGVKRILLWGSICFALVLFPVYQGLTHFANPALAKAQVSAPVKLLADPNLCSDANLFDSSPKTECDKIKQYLLKRGINLEFVSDGLGAGITLKIGTEISSKMSHHDSKHIETLLTKAGYPQQNQDANADAFMIFLLATFLLYFVAAFGPISTLLCESFPTRVRSTAISLPYHLGHGIIGGLIPTVAYSLVILSGNIYYGLFFPISIIVLAVFFGSFFLKESHEHDLNSIN